MWSLFLAMTFALAWLLTSAVWFVMHGRERMKRDALQEKLHRVVQHLAGVERKKAALIIEIDAYKTSLERLRVDRTRPPLKGDDGRATPRIALVSRREEGPAFEDTQIL